MIAYLLGHPRSCFCGLHLLRSHFLGGPKKPLLLPLKRSLDKFCCSSSTEAGLSCSAVIIILKGSPKIPKQFKVTSLYTHSTSPFHFLCSPYTESQHGTWVSRCPLTLFSFGTFQISGNDLFLTNSNAYSRDGYICPCVMPPSPLTTEVMGFAPVK